MKITIEPTVEKPETHYDATAHYVSVSCDTRTNDDNTTDADNALLGLAVFYGHHPKNVANSALQWAEENCPEEKSND